MPRVQDSEVEMNPSSGGLISLTPDQLKDMIAAAIAAGVREATKPTPEQQEKLDSDKRNKERAQQARIEVGNAAAKERVARQATCNHKMDNGNAEKFCINGQLHSDGLMHPICLRCQMEFKPYRPTPFEYSQMQG